jgi:hypothetical protein
MGEVEKTPIEILLNKRERIELSIHCYKKDIRNSQETIDLLTGDLKRAETSLKDIDNAILLLREFL